MCKHMQYITRELQDLSFEQLEKVKRVICSTLCSGNCKEEYIK